MKIIENFDDLPMLTNERHQYIRYRLGRIKHQLWLWNRKNKDECIIEQYDWFIVNNLKQGNTCVFGCAGYYLDDVIKNLTVIEQHPIVKKFYPSAHIIKDRTDIEKIGKFDNFIVTNARGDHWVTLDGLIQHFKNYIKSMNAGCLFFYSFRDTQIHFNRLKVNQYQYFLEWATSLKDIGLNLKWHSIKFASKERQPDESYDGWENPDTTNGNIKFIFQYITDDCIIKE